jgi:hypothetical protein
MEGKKSQKSFFSKVKDRMSSAPATSSSSTARSDSKVSAPTSIPSSSPSVPLSSDPIPKKFIPKTSDQFSDFGHDDSASVDEGTTPGETNLSQENYKFPILKNDATLRDIGDRMRAIHHEVQSVEEAKLREYTKTELPQIKSAIKTLQKEIEMLKSRALIEKDEGPGHLESLSAEITKSESRIVDLQSRMHFPFANFVMGSEGLSGACSDLWVENISGRLEINVLHTSGGTPDSPAPSKLSLRFHGPNGVQDGSGLTIKLRVTDFKLRSEGSTIPSLSFQELKWDVVVRISAVLTYLLKRYEQTSRMGHWVCPSSDFHLEVVTITAPISLDSRLVSALLKPQLMKIVSLLLPSLPSPRPRSSLCCPRSSAMSSLPLADHKPSARFKVPPSLPLLALTWPGNFSLIGTKMDLMARKMVFSREVCQLVSCSATQLAVFRFMQKSVNTPSRIKTLDDLIAYILKYR